MLSFHLTVRALPLQVVDGVAAFDPVTLLIACRTLAADTEVQTIPNIDLPSPPALASLAIIETFPTTGVPTQVTVTIDTGVMRWASGLDAEGTTFEDYTGAIRYGVDLGESPALFLPDGVLSRAPMTLPNGEPVTIWLAELAGPDERAGQPGHLDGLEILARALHFQEQWHLATEYTQV